MNQRRPVPRAVQRAAAAATVAGVVWATQLFPAVHTAFHRPDHLHRGGAVLPAGWAEAARAEAHEHPHPHGHDPGHAHPGDHGSRPPRSHEPARPEPPRHAPDNDHGRGSFAHFAVALPAVEAAFALDIETVAVAAPPSPFPSASRAFAVVVPPLRGPPPLLPA